MIAAAALALLTAINCFGVRAGSRVQSIMTLTAIAVIALLEVSSFFARAVANFLAALLDRPASFNLLDGFGSAMTPVLFAYGGWQTSSFLARRSSRRAENFAARQLFLACWV